MKKQRKFLIIIIQSFLKFFKTKVDNKNKQLLEKIDKEFNELKEHNEKLEKGIEEQESESALEEQYKKFKSNYYNFITNLEENQIKLKSYTDTLPKEMLNSNDTFIHSLKTLEKGGTYSQREVDFNKNELDKINNDIIIKILYQIMKY